MRLAVKGSEILVWPGTAFFGSFTDTSLAAGQAAVTGSNVTVTVGRNGYGGAGDGERHSVVGGAARGGPAVDGGDGRCGGRGDRGLPGLPAWGRVSGDGDGDTVHRRIGAAGDERSVRHCGVRSARQCGQRGGDGQCDGAVVVGVGCARRIGVRPTGSYWGASGEQIDVESGNLNFSVPLLKAQSRGGWGVSFGLSYNSQMWRRDAAGHVWKLGGDVGYGLGWKLQAGSVRPVWNDTGSVSHYVFGDSTGGGVPAGGEYGRDVDVEGRDLCRV